MKVKLLLLFVSINLIGYSQTVDFQLQADGTFKNNEEPKDYTVIEYEGKSREDLYSEILIGVTRLYNSPKDVISKVENEIISVNGISTNCVTLKGMMGVRVNFSIQYVIQFQFKEGKIRVDAPVISRLFTDDTPDIKPFSGWLKVQNVFKKGKPNKQETINDFNNTLNGLINNILKGKTTTDEDW